MSTAVEQMPVMNEPSSNIDIKTELKPQVTTTPAPTAQELKNQHPLHQFDLTQMSKLYAACVGKFKESNPSFEPTKWAEKKASTVSAANMTHTIFSSKQRLYEAFNTLALESGEPMILMPNFDYGDILNFERFLQALKQDGVNAIGKYKLYLNNKDTRKFEVDMVVVHPRYGVLLFEVKDCDQLDSKRRSRAKAQLNNARSCFESMGRLIAESKGWTHGEAHIMCSDFIVLPNVQERPVFIPKQNLNQSLNQSNVSTASNTRSPRQITYMIKSDMMNKESFAKWFTEFVVEPKQEREKLMEEQNKMNKFDLHAMNYMLGLINCVRNNSIMPVVYPETEMGEQMMMKEDAKIEKTDEVKEEKTEEAEKEKLMEKIETHFQPALNVHGEFFQAEHEAVRALSKVMIISKDSETIRKTISLQTLWFLLNDSQKKISVVCSEQNKAYYEEFFSRQRKLYNNLNNVRFYSNLTSCAVSEGQHTIKTSGETWFFDSGIDGKLIDIITRAKDLNAYWIFTDKESEVAEHMTMLKEMKVKEARLDVNMEPIEDNENMTMPWLTGKSIKFPLRLQCDLLVIGDLIGLTQLKSLYRYLKSTHVVNYASQNQHNRDNYNSQPKQQQLNFNPSKKFRSVKFIRGGSIENLRSSLKMHDSIQAQVVLMHVGDEDLFKSRNSLTTVDRIKELTTLVKEYCPKSFTIVSNLMKRMSRTENTTTNEVNKSVAKFCKDAKEVKEMSHLVWMSNGHLEPEYHTQEGGRVLNNKGLRLYVDNFLYTVDYYMIKNHKQH